MLGYTPNVHGGFIGKKYVSKYIKISKNWSNAQIIFLPGFTSQRALNKDPTVWLDGARPPPKYSYRPIQKHLWWTGLIHPMHMLDSSTIYAVESIVSRIHLSGGIIEPPIEHVTLGRSNVHAKREGRLGFYYLRQKFYDTSWH